MTGETNLAILLRNMRPALQGEAFGFFSLVEEVALPLLPLARGVFRDAEGVTLILSLETTLAEGLRAETPWALITLTVHSSLEAVGFLAAISSVLAAAGISLNAVSACRHDHLFVPWDRRLEALALLEGLAGDRPSGTP